MMSFPSRLTPGRKRMRILRRPTESIRPSSPRPERRDCHGRLAALLLTQAGEGASLDDAGFRPWCSATFIGAQHRFSFRIAGPGASAHAERLVTLLPEAEFALPGHVVADLAVDAVRQNGDADVLIDLAVLTVEDW